MNIKKGEVFIFSNRETINGLALNWLKSTNLWTITKSHISRKYKNYTQIKSQVSHNTKSYSKSILKYAFIQSMHLIQLCHCAYWLNEKDATNASLSKPNANYPSSCIKTWVLVEKQSVCTFDQSQEDKIHWAVADTCAAECTNDTWASSHYHR